MLPWRFHYHPVVPHEADERADVLIIGAGPAGTTAAALLRMYRPSLHVVVVDRAEFPRPHVGESLLPNTNSVLAKLRILERVDRAGFVRKGGVAYKWRRGADCFVYRFADGEIGERHESESYEHPAFTWQVRRDRYDALLMDRARELGAQVREQVSVVDTIGDRSQLDGVVIEDQEGRRSRIEARWTIDASGQARVLGRALGIERQEHELGDLAVYRYYRGAGWNESILASPELSNIFFAATSTGWMWYIPLSRDEVSVGLVSRREFIKERGLDGLFEDELATVPEMAALLENAEQIPEPGGTGDARSLATQNWSYGHEQLAGPGWFLTGDAAAFVDPVLSSGVMLAQCSGTWVANAINTLLDDASLAETIAHDYTATYAAAREGFVEMARWWYHNRDLGEEDWWRTAGVLTRQATGRTPLDDRRAFIDLLAGYLTDRRLSSQIDLSFGAEAQGRILRTLVDVPLEMGPRGGDHEQTCRLAIRHRGVEVDVYYGTDTNADRWWPLPRFMFSMPEGTFEYRPPADGVEVDVEMTARIVSAMLDLAGQGVVLGDLIPGTRARLGDVPHGIAERITGDLLTQRIIEVTDEHAVVLSRREDVADRTRPIRRVFDSMRVEWREVKALGRADTDRLPTVMFSGGGGARRYLPPVRLRSGNSDATTIVDGLTVTLDELAERSYEDTVRSLSSKLGDAGLEAGRAHDVANQLLGELVTLGVLAVD